MSYVIDKCRVGGCEVIFDEDPYKNPKATRYWRSTYEKVDNPYFIVQRKIPSRDKKGRIKIQNMTEYVLALYCGPECGLDDYEQRWKGN